MRSRSFQAEDRLALHECDVDRDVASAEALTGETWVADGNYREVRPIVWGRANALLWLDYSLPVCLWRLTRRLWRRGVKQEELWNGNRERFWPHLKLWSEDSLFHWLFKTYWRRKRETPMLLAQPEHAHLHLIRFRSSREAQAWLTSL